MLDFDKVEQVRRQIPIFKQRRTDVYDLARASTWNWAAGKTTKMNSYSKQ